LLVGQLVDDRAANLDVARRRQRVQVRHRHFHLPRLAAAHQRDGDGAADGAIERSLQGDEGGARSAVHEKQHVARLHARRRRRTLRQNLGDGENAARCSRRAQGRLGLVRQAEPQRLVVRLVRHHHLQCAARHCCAGPQQLQRPRHTVEREEEAGGGA